MWRNYLLIAWRNLRKNKVFSLINILGLAFGLTCFLLIAMWVQDELSYDRFHRNAARMYRLNLSLTWPENQLLSEGAPLPLGPALQANLPGIRTCVRTSEPRQLLLKYGDKKLYAKKVLSVDSTFLDVFTFPVLSGDAKTCLSGTNGLVMTKGLAEKLFGTADNAVGRVVEVQDGAPRTVTAVLENIPANSHLQFDALGPMPAFANYATEANSWEYFNYPTYLLLAPGTGIEQLEGRLKYFYRKVIEPVMGGDDTFKLIISFQPLTDVHLGSTHLRGHENGATMAYIYAFSGIAVFMLLLACINYMNLATARSLKRAKEVGIRKVVGSGRWQLIGQYLAESLLVTGLSLVIGLTLVQAVTPLFNHVTGKSISILAFLGGPELLALAGIALLTGLVSGSYPAFVLSAFKPVEVLKGGVRTVARGLWLRRGLVVFQFAISALMIAGTLVVYRQLQYMKDKHRGFDQEQILTVKLESEAVARKANLFKDRLLGKSEVAGVTFANFPIGEFVSSSNFGFQHQGKTLDMLSETFAADYDYLKVMNIPLKEGRHFNRALSTDTASVLINETLARRLGAGSALGAEASWGSRQYKVIGVFKDFHVTSLHHSIQPLLLTLTPEAGRYLYVKGNVRHIESMRRTIAGVYAGFRTDYPLEINFLDQTFARQYEEDERKSNLFLAFSAITIFIACLGLFGLAAFSMEQRTKEVGIRKTLGASVPDLVHLLSRDFLVLVLVANGVAGPLAWFGLQAWLRAFPYRVNVTGWEFAATGALTVGIALLTVGFQTLKAAGANPVNSLRSE
jgi:putative ABC transport system permease protein